MMGNRTPVASPQNSRKLQNSGGRSQKPAEMQPRPEALRQDAGMGHDPIHADTEEEMAEKVDRRHAAGHPQSNPD